MARRAVRRRPRAFAGAHGCLHPRARTILIASGLAPGLVRQTMLHEMCHIGSPGHGRRFRATLARLAGTGEGWASRERVLYEDICGVAPSRR